MEKITKGTLVVSTPLGVAFFASAQLQHQAIYKEDDGSVFYEYRAGFGYLITHLKVSLLSDSAVLLGKHIELNLFSDATVGLLPLAQGQKDPIDHELRQNAAAYLAYLLIDTTTETVVYTITTRTGQPQLRIQKNY